MAARHDRRCGPAVLATAAMLATPLFALAQRSPAAGGQKTTNAASSQQAGTASVQGYDLATLNKDSLARIDNVGVRLDLNLFRLDPKFLDALGSMRYFVVLNNCKAAGNIDQRIVKVLDNELDYPKVSAYYKSRAASTLENLPTTATISIAGASLGPYDTAKKVFPILYGRRKLEFTSVRVNADRSKLSNFCLDAMRQILNAPEIPNLYDLTFTPTLAFTELPMDEASARTYIEHTNEAQRVIAFDIDFRILDSPPQITWMNPSTPVAAMTAQIEKITIVKGYTGQKVAVLYERPTQNAKLP